MLDVFLKKSNTPSDVTAHGRYALMDIGSIHKENASASLSNKMAGSTEVI